MLSWSESNAVYHDAVLIPAFNSTFRYLLTFQIISTDFFASNRLKHWRNWKKTASPRFLLPGRSRESLHSAARGGARLQRDPAAVPTMRRDVVTWQGQPPPTVAFNRRLT
jgi:hypothetical protein